MRTKRFRRYSPSTVHPTLLGLIALSIEDLIRRARDARHSTTGQQTPSGVVAATLCALFVGLGKLLVSGVLWPTVPKYRDRWALLAAAIEVASPSTRGGLWLEFGVASGTSLEFITRTSQRPTIGFDSFEGLPENWNPFFRKGAFSLQGTPPAIPGESRLIKGLFDVTLPSFVAGLDPFETISFLHIDSDLYTSARTVLQVLGKRVTIGTVIVFDEYCQVAPDDEARAFRETARHFGWRYRYIGCGARGTGSLPIALQIVT